jgi:hypothetical protein
MLKKKHFITEDFSSSVDISSSVKINHVILDAKWLHDTNLLNIYLCTLKGDSDECLLD